MRRLFIALLILLIITPVLVFAGNAEQTCGTNVVHLVQQGENLFRISLRYGTSMNAIANANGIVNIHRIYAGQQLIIPCATTTTQQPFSPSVLYITPQPLIIPVATVVQTGGAPTIAQLGSPNVDCSRFRATSPLDGLANGSNVFYWDAAPGATSYRVNIYNLELGGALMASYETSGVLTRLQGDVSDGAVGGGFHFAWEVQAMVSDHIACSSPRLAMLRSLAPTAVPTTAPAVP